MLGVDQQQRLGARASHFPCKLLWLTYTVTFSCVTVRHEFAVTSGGVGDAVAEVGNSDSGSVNR